MPLLAAAHIKPLAVSQVMKVLVSVSLLVAVQRVLPLPTCALDPLISSAALKTNVPLLLALVLACKLPFALPRVVLPSLDIALVHLIYNAV